MTDRSQFADPEKKALFSAAKKVKTLTPVIGTEITGVDLRQLSDQQKDELYVTHCSIIDIIADHAVKVIARGRARSCM